MKTIALLLVTALLLNAFPKVYAQDKSAKGPEVFDTIEAMVMNGKKVEKIPARLKLEEKSLTIESKKTGAVLKTFSYGSFKSIQYSYSRHPRWKAGLGVAAAGVALGAGVASIQSESEVALLSVPIFLFAPMVGWTVGKTKSRRHWVSIKTRDDYTVIRLDKRDYKYILVALETRTGLKVEDVGEKK